MNEIVDMQERDGVMMVVLRNVQGRDYSMAQSTIISKILRKTLVSSPEDRYENFNLIKSYLRADEYGPFFVIPLDGIHLYN